MNNEKRQLQEGQGILFANESQNVSAPNYKGIIKINGEIISIVAWKNKSKAGQEYISIQKDKKGVSKEADPGQTSN